MDNISRIDAVMVVDDSTVQRQYAVSLFVGQGAGTVTEAANGQEALDMLLKLKKLPSLLVLDLEMPRMDGVECMQKLHANNIRLPIVIVSSREPALLTSVETIATHLGMPLLAVLQKPLRQENVTEVIRLLGQIQPAENKKQSGRQPALTEQELREALENNELVAYYQPKVDIRTGIIKGAEALARLQSVKHGFVTPDRFITVAEKHGLINAMTLQMIEQAMQQVVRWNERALPLKIAVNLSALSLDDPDFLQQIMALQEKYQVDPAQLVFEITESAVVSGTGPSLGALARLRLKGFGLSIDDYGTGFSSMQQLTMVPFTELKVDRSFVDGAHEKEHLRVLLQSALDMAHKLKLVTVAEGIETMEDWRLLQASGCHIGQGFLIGKPMPASEFPVWLKEHHRRLDSLQEKK